MFERYTETARRALFFARYEATELGQLEITSALLLLGLARSTAIQRIRELVDALRGKLGG